MSDEVVEVITEEVLADETDEEVNSQVMFEYSIKIVNPIRMSQFKNVRVCKWISCHKISELRSFLGVKVLRCLLLKLMATSLTLKLWI